MQTARPVVAEQPTEALLPMHGPPPPGEHMLVCFQAADDGDDEQASRCWMQPLRSSLCIIGRGEQNRAVDFRMPAWEGIGVQHAALTYLTGTGWTLTALDGNCIAALPPEATAFATNPASTQVGPAGLEVQVNNPPWTVPEPYTVCPNSGTVFFHHHVHP